MQIPGPGHQQLMLGFCRSLGREGCPLWNAQVENQDSKLVLRLVFEKHPLKLMR